jgi:methyl-accepting chemotaxis protein
MMNIIHNLKISMRIAIGFGFLLSTMVVLIIIARQITVQADPSLHPALNFIIGIGVSAIALGILIAFLITRSITRTTTLLSMNVERIARGDLSVTSPFAGHDELSALGRQINRMAGSFEKMIHNMMTSANSVVTSVDVLRSLANKSFEGAQNQSTQAGQIATATEEMSHTINDISKNASDASEASIEAKDTAEAGQEVADTAVDKVNSVHTSTAELSKRIVNLNKRVGEIGDIVGVISGIADQTNLLALNAAIEAARAGEQGRGFAVVADEVRKLAERTIKSTTEISQKISAVQKESDKTSEFMKQASGEVKQAKDFISNIRGVLNVVVVTVQKVNDQITRIATAVEEQSSASEHVAMNIVKTSVISKEMETMSGDVMREVNGLTSIAEELRSVASGFTTTGSTLLIGPAG